MPTITRIGTQKRAGRYNVDLDGRFAFGVAESVLIKYGLVKGRELSPAMIEEIQLDDQVAQALKIALNYLGPALRTVHQVQERLNQKEIKPEVQGLVIEKLIANQYLDDLNYARHYVANKQKFQPRGPLVIAADLRLAGVDPNFIETALADYSEEQQLAVAQKLGAHAQKTNRRDAQYLQQQKVVRAIAQKGFSFDIAQAATANLDWSTDEEEEEAKLARQLDKLNHRYRNEPARSRFYKIKNKLYSQGFPLDMIENALDEANLD
ncbi:RecX family transcriptional regulator [Leuconostocaceae bacterium ESL0723]|nr:RecX family transcriptional regulator [Leuconostocaceae bacterium ESL0723]